MSTEHPWQPLSPPGMRPGQVRVEIDDEVGAAYVHISDAPVVETVERWRDRIMVDLDADGNTVGVELLLDVAQMRTISTRKWRLGRRKKRRSRS